MLALRQVEHELYAYGRAISECMAGASTRIAGHMNLAFMACCVDAIYWPDYRCVERWVKGHTIVGDIPDTGLFRQLFQPYRSAESVLSLASNEKWNRKLRQSLARQAEGFLEPEEKALLVACL